MPLDLTTIRSQFPALHQQAGVIFFDNPGGTQIAQQLLLAVQHPHVPAEKFVL